VQKLLETIGLLLDRIGHEISVRILPTMYDGRTRYARETLADIRELFKDLCYDTVIRQNVKLREASRSGLPISRFAPTANGALDYASVAIEVEASVPVDFAELDVSKDLKEIREVAVHYRNAAAGDVRIAGDFNGWVPDKGVRSIIESSEGARVWTKVLHLPPGTYQYRYVVDGEWQSDPTNAQQTTGPEGRVNSVLVVR
jgi:hypothetical protein